MGRRRRRVLKKSCRDINDLQKMTEDQEAEMETLCAKRQRSESESSSDGPHPLLIDHIVEKVLVYSDNFVESVKLFRLVCQQWRTIATKLFRKEHGRICFDDDFNRRTAQFISVMKNCQDPLWDKYKLSGGFVIYKPFQGHYVYDKIYNELFRVCMPWMKSWEFKSHNPSDLKFPKKLDQYDLSHLSTLSFHICVFFKELQLKMPSYLGEIFDAAKNLRQFDIRVVSADPSSGGEAQQLNIMKLFGDIIGTKLPKTCKHLKLNMILTSMHFQLLEERGLELECLIIDFQKVNVDTKAISSFLRSQSKSLRSLDFTEAPVFKMELPPMPNLSLLKIEGKPRIPCFKFETFPKLQSLEIMFYWIYQEENWLQNLLLDTGQSQSVKAVELLCEINETDLFILYRIIKCFPKLSRFSSVLNTPKALKTIFTSMQFLEALEIVLAREFWEFRAPQKMGRIDQAFCGMPAAICIQLLRENDFSLTELPAKFNRPSLRDLKQLKTLKIRGFRADRTPFTDVSIHYGVLQMPSLTHLVLDVFPISKQSISILDKRLNLYLLPGPPTLS